MKETKEILQNLNFHKTSEEIKKIIINNTNYSYKTKSFSEYFSIKLTSLNYGGRYIYEQKIEQEINKELLSKIFKKPIAVFIKLLITFRNENGDEKIINEIIKSLKNKELINYTRHEISLTITTNIENLQESLNKLISELKIFTNQLETIKTKYPNFAKEIYIGMLTKLIYNKSNEMLKNIIKYTQYIDTKHNNTHNKKEEEKIKELIKLENKYCDLIEISITNMTSMLEFELFWFRNFLII